MSVFLTWLAEEAGDLPSGSRLVEDFRLDEVFIGPEDPGARRIAVHLANRWTARVIANSKATAEAFIAGGGLPDKVRVVHNGITPDPFLSVDDAEVAALRDELGLTGFVITATAP